MRARHCVDEQFFFTRIKINANAVILKTKCSDLSLRNSIDLYVCSKVVDVHVRSVAPVLIPTPAFRDALLHRLHTKISAQRRPAIHTVCFDNGVCSR